MQKSGRNIVILHSALAVTMAIFALAIRLWGADRSFNNDELITMTYIREPVIKILYFCLSYDFHPPLFYWIQKMWSAFFPSYEESVARLCPIFLSLAPYLLIPWFMRLRGRNAGIILGFFIAFYPMGIFLSQLIRDYGPSLSALTIFWMLSFNRWLGEKVDRKWEVLAAAIAGYFNYIAIIWVAFTYLAQLIVPLSKDSGRSERLETFRRGLWVALLFLPWFCLNDVIIQIITGQALFWSAPLLENVGDPKTWPEHIHTAVRMRPIMFDSIRNIFSASWIVGLIFIFYPLLAWKEARSTKESGLLTRFLYLSFCIKFLFIGFIAGYSLFFHSLAVGRYMSALPLLFLFDLSFFVALSKNVNYRKLISACAAAVCIIFVTYWVKVMKSYEPGGVRESFVFVKSQIQEGDQFILLTLTKHKYDFYLEKLGLTDRIKVKHVWRCPPPDIQKRWANMPANGKTYLLAWSQINCPVSPPPEFNETTHQFIEAQDQFSEMRYFGRTVLKTWTKNISENK